jgi:tetratricopeptide (TPR) repeat protein
MTRHFRLILALALALLGVAGPVGAAVTRQGLSQADLFVKADDMRAAGHVAEAVVIYDALAHDPNLEVRTEARFRKATLLAKLKRYRESVRTFRVLLDEKPTATGVRLEMARVLALMGDNEAARRELRKAQSAGLPPDVALAVDQFRNALRTTQPIGGSIQVSLASSNNINRATTAATLATVLSPNPIPLSASAQAQSGEGLALSGQSFARLALDANIGILARFTGSANLYRASQFNDLSTDIKVGPEWAVGGDRWRPAAGYGQRWYGGSTYSRTKSLSLNWLHPIDKRTQLTTDLAYGWLKYPKIALQSGTSIDGSLLIEHQFSTKWGGSLTLAGGRQAARDPGYATSSGALTAFVWRDIGPMQVFGIAGGSLVEGDAALYPFPARRHDRGTQFSAGAIFRKFTWHGLAPVIRVTRTANVSTVGIYRYEQTAANFGFARAF